MNKFFDLAKNIVISIRIKHWLKNGFIFIPLIFAKLLFDKLAVLKLIETFVLFCLLSSAIYLINDVIDKEKDKIHPYKSRRPIASGALSVKIAVICSLILVAVSLFFAFKIGYALGLIFLFYLLWNLLYSFYLKNLVIFDIFAVSGNYLLRVYAGAISINVLVSPYLFLIILLFSLLVSSGKRKHEFNLLNEGAMNHRPVLKEYSYEFLDQLIIFSSILATVIYLLYTIASETITKFETVNLIYTTPIVIYGMMRYLYLVNIKKIGSPIEAFLSDKPLFWSVILWLLACILIIYFKI